MMFNTIAIDSGRSKVMALKITANCGSCRVCCGTTAKHNVHGVTKVAVWLGLLKGNGQDSKVIRDRHPFNVLFSRTIWVSR